VREDIPNTRFLEEQIMKKLLNISVNTASKAVEISNRLNLDGRLNWVDKFIVDYSGKAEYVIWYEAI